MCLSATMPTSLMSDTPPNPGMHKTSARRVLDDAHVVVKSNRLRYDNSDDLPTPVANGK
jgi:hypothetical protein